MKAAIVLTTIRIPKLLEGYAHNLEVNKHYDVGFIVIGDKLTPNGATSNLMDRIKSRGFDAEYWSIRDQREWIVNFPKLKEIIPYNSDNRRNIGFLIAAEKGAEIIITIDDDNCVGSSDYFKEHSIVGTIQGMKTIKSENNWFNPCSMLRTDPPRIIYPRGFPYSKRWHDKTQSSYSVGKVVLNMGLWTGNPDVDAITNLNEPIKSIEITSEQIMLASGTFAPINTQNTAFHLDILPCYYYVLMGAKIRGLKLDRYGDIWSGLFAKKVIDTIGWRATIGRPLTIHRRNYHDFFKDLQAELWGMILTERIVPIVESMELNEKDAKGAYLELADCLDKIDVYPDKTVEKFFKKMTKAMRIWVETCEKLIST